MTREKSQTRRLGVRLAGVFLCVLAALALRADAQAPATTLVSEALFGARTGAEKRESALSFVSAAIALGESVTNRDIVDEAKFREGLSKIIDGVVQCLNASAWAKAK